MDVIKAQIAVEVHKLSTEKWDSRYVKQTENFEIQKKMQDALIKFQSDNQQNLKSAMRDVLKMQEWMKV